MRQQMIRLWRWGLVLGATFAWIGMAVGQEEASKPAAEQSAEKSADEKPAADQQAGEAEKEKEQQDDAAKQAAEAKAKEAAAAEEAAKQKALRKLKVFTLKHRSPQEMQQILAMCTRGPSPSGFASGFPAAGTPGGFVAAPAAAAPGSAADGVSEQPPLIAADSAKRLLFVRGSDEQLKQVEQLIQAFDVTEKDFQPQTFGNLHLIKVKDGNAGRVHGILSQLQLNSQMIHLGDLSLIAIHTGESEADKALAQQAQEVITTLEAEEPKKEEEKAKDETSKDEATKDESGEKSEEAKADEKKEKDEEKKDEEKKDEPTSDEKKDGTT